MKRFIAAVRGPLILLGIWALLGLIGLIAGVLPPLPGVAGESPQPEATTTVGTGNDDQAGPSALGSEVVVADPSTGAETGEVAPADNPPSDAPAGSDPSTAEGDTAAIAAANRTQQHRVIVCSEEGEAPTFVLGDLLGDPAQELVVACGTHTDVLTQVGDGFERRVRIAGADGSAQIRDLDGDGDDDLLLCSSLGSFRVDRQTMGLSDPEPVHPGACQAVTSVGSGDSLLIVTALAVDDGTHLAFSRDDASTDTRSTRALAFVDLAGDGNADLLALLDDAVVVFKDAQGAMADAKISLHETPADIMVPLAGQPSLLMGPSPARLSLQAPSADSEPPATERPLQLAGVDLGGTLASAQSPIVETAEGFGLVSVAEGGALSVTVLLSTRPDGFELGPPTIGLFRGEPTTPELLFSARRPGAPWELWIAQDASAEARTWPHFAEPVRPSSSNVELTLTNEPS